MLHALATLGWIVLGVFGLCVVALIVLGIVLGRSDFSDSVGGD